MSSTEHRLQLILTVLQSKIAGSGVLLVTGASELDDVSGLVIGLTALARGAGYTACHVALQDFSVSDSRQTVAELDRLIAAKKAESDIVFVEAPILQDTPFAAHVASTAAGTVLAVALGRPLTSRDDETAQLLRELDARVLGVVATRLRARGPNAQSRGGDDKAGVTASRR